MTLFVEAVSRTSATGVVVRAPHAREPRNEHSRPRKVFMFLSNSGLPPTLFHALTSALRWTSAPKTSNFA